MHAEEEKAGLWEREQRRDAEETEMRVRSDRQ